jgi:AbrB family looped-hinge helix DNA binding protein
MKSMIAHDGRVAIPLQLRELLGLEPGDVLDFTVENDMLKLRKLGPDEEPFDEFAGLVDLDISPEELVRESRVR